MTADKAFAAMYEALKQDIRRELLEELRPLLNLAEDKQLTIDEAAEKLRISRETLYRLCKEGQIEHISIGVIGSRKPRIIFSGSTLDAWMKRKQVESITAKRLTATF